jgi:hypothetical protein
MAKTSKLNHLYRAAIVRTLLSTEWDEDDDLQDCLKQALAVRTNKDIDDWFNNWPKIDAALDKQC